MGMFAVLIGQAQNLSIQIWLRFYLNRHQIVRHFDIFKIKVYNTINKQ